MNDPGKEEVIALRAKITELETALTKRDELISKLESGIKTASKALGMLQENLSGAEREKGHIAIAKLLEQDFQDKLAAVGKAGSPGQ